MPVRDMPDMPEVQHVASPAGTARRIYRFGGAEADGGAEMKTLLGGKGANLAEMAKLGLPVPPGFTITTEVCKAFSDAGGRLPSDLDDEIEAGLVHISGIVDAQFGDIDNPLLLSVRSGGRASMPGMMDTILNLGLNDKTVKGLAKRSGDARFAFDSYRRFVQMYASVVMQIDHGMFEDILENYKNLSALGSDTDLSAEDWQEVIGQYNSAIESESGAEFPQDVRAQLIGAISAVFRSWDNPRAATYRRLNNIPKDWGTAVNVQAMVFGNRGNTSATGVGFTRNPSTGVAEVYGEYLINAQGEDVVAGIRTPQPLANAARDAAGDAGTTNVSLETALPETYRELLDVFGKLEAHFRDMQDVEFTVQEGKLWLLQTRTGKRTSEAALNIATTMADDGAISREEAVARIDPHSLDQLLHPTLDEDADNDVIARGLPASPGAASGEIVFLADDAEAAKSHGRDVILVRTETSPEDIHGMHAAVGILTARGGMTSHAAVVARGMGRPCVSGASALRIEEAAGKMTINGEVYLAGDVITIDGATGRVLRGAAKMRQPALSGAFSKLMGWADGIRRLKVRANADTPRDAEQARKFGAEGIGLCRTEHMFFEADRILAMRRMICADDPEGRQAALDEILDLQRGDFVQLFKIMAGLPITIRLLDPPLHEFLPNAPEEIAAVAKALRLPRDRVKARIAELSEVNPMLGFRGARLAVRYPEIPEMQARAIFEAALTAAKDTGDPVMLEIMLPLVAFRREFDLLADIVRKTARDVMAEQGQDFSYDIGTMVELPRAVLVADRIASGEDGAAFFSFGTNDLTQTCLGLSRDDAAPILQTYTEQGIFDVDPFVSIDVDGVGALIEMGTAKGRAAKPNLKVGICGEHGGDPASVAFCDGLGLDYVSCSPFRVPVARLAAAQAVLKARTQTEDA